MKLRIILSSVLAFLFFTHCGDGNENATKCSDVTCGTNATCNIGTGECECDNGYNGDPYTNCTESGLCNDVICGANATCNTDTGICECDANYIGDPDTGCTFNDTCEADTCNGHGTCDDAGGVVTCDCDTGYNGDFCNECDHAAGYAPDPQNPGACIQDTCVPDPSSIVCEDKMCGQLPDGCGGTLNCGSCGIVGTCNTAGTSCSCPSDTNEPNNNFSSATDLGSFTDDPDSSWFENFSIHTDSDEDWFIFNVQDTGFSGNPHISVWLNPMDPEDPSQWNEGSDESDYELIVWYSCNNGGNEHSCEDGFVSTDLSHGFSCWDPGNYQYYPGVRLGTECSGTTDESGTAVVMVRKQYRHGYCDSYDLSISVF